MSSKELERLQSLQRMADKRATQRQAAEAIGLTVRQMQRLRDAYEARGAAGLVSARRGKRSNRALPDAYKGARRRPRARAVHGLRTDSGAREAVRDSRCLRGRGDASHLAHRGQRLGDAGRAAQAASATASRRECFDELVQIDGCDHHWFEDHGPACSLLVYVDDASSALVELRFARTESTFDHFAATESYLRRYGKPLAFYSDKLSVFRVTAKEAVGGVAYTQFGPAMHDLNIDIIMCQHACRQGSC